MRVSNDTGLLHGSKSCARNPPQAEMVFVVRGKYLLRDGAPLTLYRSELISDAMIASARETSEEAAEGLHKGSVQLGQDSLRAEVLEDQDEARVGELLYPGDFADFKLNAEVMLRGSCYAPQGSSQCEVEFAVGAWKKRLRVVGHRVRTDDIAGGTTTKATPIGVLAIDYAHAYGGPGFSNNPVGKGHVQKLEASQAGEAPEDPLYQPPRSQRSAVMPSEQLPNIYYADGSNTKHGLSAGFGPINPAWPHRNERLGKKYDDTWRKTRAPYFSSDFDWRYFHAAPPDQQLDGYLRGDEEIKLENVHRAKRTVRAKLPQFRVRVFVLDDSERCHELPMQLDTLFVDMHEEALYLTWRGHVAVRERDLTDIKFALVDTEPLAEQRLPTRHYEARLRAFAADPIGMDNAFPDGFLDYAKRMEDLEDASEDELEVIVDRAMQTKEPGGPLGYVQRMVSPPAPSGAPATNIDSELEEAGKRLEHVELRAKVREMLFSLGGSSGPGIVMPLEPGEKPRMSIGPMLRQGEQQVYAQKAALAKQAGVDSPQLQKQFDAALERLRNNPLAGLDPNYTPYSPDDPPPAEPGPGVDLSGRDLSEHDLSGMDLRGANLEGTVMRRTNLRGANLTGASLAAATLYKTVLTEADLSEVNLVSATFERVVAERTIFRGAKLGMTRFAASNFKDARLDEVTGKMSTFTKCDLRGASLFAAKLHKVRFEECELRAANVAETELDRCEFHTCQATGLQLLNATLHGSSFHKSNLTDANVRGAVGEGSVWTSCNLRRADFSFAALRASFFLHAEARDTNFSYCNIEMGRFDRAILRNANFGGAKLSSASFQSTMLTKASFKRASLYDAKIVEAAGTDVDFSEANLTNAIFERSELER